MSAWWENMGTAGHLTQTFVLCTASDAHRRKDRENNEDALRQPYIRPCSHKRKHVC